jgi:hypothetical protein
MSDLNADALEPARIQDALASLPRAVAPSAPKDGDGGPPKRRPGRPPGSKNKPKDPQATANVGGGPTVVVPGRGRPTLTEKSPEEIAREKRAKLELKRDRAKKIADYLTGDFSEQMLEMLVSSTPIDPDIIFTKAAPTTKRSKNPNLTETGQRFAVPPDVAEAWGRVLAELSTSTTGGKLVESFESGNAGLVLACLIAALTTSRYIRSLKNDFKLIQSVIQAKQQAESNLNGIPIA